MVFWSSIKYLQKRFSKHVGSRWVPNAVQSIFFSSGVSSGTIALYDDAAWETHLAELDDSTCGCTTASLVSLHCFFTE